MAFTQRILWEMHCSALHNCAPEDPDIAALLANFSEVVAQSTLTRRHDDPVGTFSFVLLLSDLSEPQLAAIADAPSTVLPLLEYLRALQQFKMEQQLLHHPHPVPAQCCLSLHAGNISPLSFHSLGTSLLRRLVVVRGTIVRISLPRPVCTEMTFECTSCRKSTIVAVDQCLEFPSRCTAGGKCRGTFHVAKTEYATCEEQQLVRLQEDNQTTTREHFVFDSSNEQASSSGDHGMARHVEVVLRRALMDSATPGDLVTVVGILQPRRGERSNARAGGAASSAAAHHLCILAHGIEAARRSSGGGGKSHASSSSFQAKRGQAGQWTAEEIRAMQAAAKDPRWFNGLVDALCPTIFGHATTKAALILALVGGTVNTHTRNAIHVALVGDPGMGKSQLLRATCAVSRRGVFVSANTSSACGLTVSVSRDSNQETTFEAGAVVHGDGGVTCIDEIDKGASEHKALLEVMEQQSLSLAKAGMIFTLPVRTTIIAAGNPIGGKYNANRSICENINMSLPLLSRFDFVFLITDDSQSVQQRNTDTKLSTHVLRMHRGIGDGEEEVEQLRQGQRNQRLNPSSTSSALTAEELMLFLDYARQQAPILGDEAKDMLRTHYLEARRKAVERSSGAIGSAIETNSDLPVTTRYLQSLVRASEARAKCDLASVVQVQHAKFAIELLEASRESRRPHLNSDAPQPTGRGRGGVKLCLRDEVAQRLFALTQSEHKEALTRDEILATCQECGCKNPLAMFEQLNEYGLILQQGHKFRLKRKLL